MVSPCSHMAVQPSMLDRQTYRLSSHHTGFHRLSSLQLEKQTTGYPAIIQAIQPSTCEAAVVASTFFKSFNHLLPARPSGHWGASACSVYTFAQCSLQICWLTGLSHMPFPLSPCGPWSFQIHRSRNSEGDNFSKTSLGEQSGDASVPGCTSMSPFQLPVLPSCHSAAGVCGPGIQISFPNHLGTCRAWGQEAAASHPKRLPSSACAVHTFHLGVFHITSTGSGRRIKGLSSHLQASRLLVAVQPFLFEGKGPLDRRNQISHFPCFAMLQNRELRGAFSNICELQHTHSLGSWCPQFIVAFDQQPVHFHTPLGSVACRHLIFNEVPENRPSHMHAHS